ncbi:MAG: GNAT family N-acetyltransferase [Bacteroidota bacterium]
MTKIKDIPPELTYAIRQAVLRKGRPIEDCYFEGDYLDTTKHFGLFIDNSLAGVASVFENKNDNFSEKSQFQLRGMAVLDSFQKMGLGKLLLTEIENLIFQKKENLIWFNAREKAVDFYKKCNYQIIDKPFEINEIGTHYIMYKKLL